ncbi:hypothetical protein V497_08760 [Pseudogymnoascus sp. VKM F-4516 (FW-969)]|nr:hypothetical protein V497_08760 [Pseudogymnoascus sp. VKM F-4516 (FW-969)]
MIRNGSKPVEGRMNEPKYAAIVAGQKITFYDGDESAEEGDGNADSKINHGNTLEAEVVEVRRFKSFREMLQAYGVEAFLPDFNGSLDDAVEVYRGFRGYREGEEEFGACAIKLMGPEIAHLDEDAKQDSLVLIISVAIQAAADRLGTCGTAPTHGLCVVRGGGSDCRRVTAAGASAYLLPLRTGRLCRALLVLDLGLEPGLNALTSQTAAATLVALLAQPGIGGSATGIEAQGARISITATAGSSAGAGACAVVCVAAAWLADAPNSPKTLIPTITTVAAAVQQVFAGQPDDAASL